MFLRSCLVYLTILCVGASSDASENQTSPELADRLGRHAVAMFAQSRYEEALRISREALAIYQAVGDEPNALELEGFMGFVHFRAEEYREAIDLWDRVLPRARELFPPQMLASILAHHGVADLELGEVQTAVDHLEEAMPLIRSLPKNPAIGQWIRALGNAYHATGRLTDAVSLLEEALDHYRDFSEREGEAETLLNLGGTYQSLGRYPEALDCFAKAERLYLDLELPGGLWTARGNRALVYHVTGRREEALRLHQQVIPALRKLGKPKELAAALNNHGTLLRTLGRLEEARPLLEESLEIRRRLKDRVGETVTLNSLSVLDWAAGRFERALIQGERALEIRRSLGDRSGEVVTLVDLAQRYADLGDPEEALVRMSRARELSQHIGNPRLQAGIAAKLAQMLFVLGRHDESVEQAHAAIRLGENLPAAASSLHAQFVLFAADFMRGRTAQAEETLNRGLQTAEALGSYQTAVLYMFRGGLAALKGDLENAQQDLETALDLHRRNRLETTLESVLTLLGFVHLSQQELEQGESLLREAIDDRDLQVGEMTSSQLVAGLFGSRLTPHNVLLDFLVSQGRAADAFDVAERARARGLLADLGKPTLQLPSKDTNRWLTEAIELRRRMAALQRQMTDWTVELREGGNKANGQDLDTLRRRYKNVLLHLRQASPESASLIAPSPLTVTDIQELLPRSTALVSFFVLPNHTVSWMIDRQYVNMGIIPVGRAEWAERAEYFQNGVERRESLEALRTQIDREMFARLPSPRHVRHVFLVPHGPLHDLPLEMFVGPDGDEPLNQTHTISRLPSASTLKFLLDKRTPFEGRVAVLGSPEGNLPGSRRETEKIAALWGTEAQTGRQASEGALRSLAGRVDLLHLSTHARFDAARPLFSHVHLAPDPDHDGRLETHEIFQLDLRGTDLVVLSACETGAEARTAADDGTGLVRALFYAGVPEVLTTLWPVDDESTAQFMVDFHRELKRSKHPARALRLARLQARADPERSHAYHWAGFTLTGLGGPWEE